MKGKREYHHFEGSTVTGNVPRGTSALPLTPSRTDYLIVWPDRPSEAEIVRGAALIPSMLDEGFLVWRVPIEAPRNG